MAAYIFASVEITDPEAYEEYRKRVPAVIEAYGGRYLVRGGTAERLEGGGEASSALSTMLTPAWTSAFSPSSLPMAALARSSATPPPGTMPSSTAALVAFMASSRGRSISSGQERVLRAKPAKRSARRCGSP